MTPSSANSVIAERARSICRKSRSGAIFSRSGRRGPARRDARPIRLRQGGQQLPQPVLLLQLAQIRRVRAAHIDDDVIRMVGQQIETPAIILHGLVERDARDLPRLMPTGTRRAPGGASRARRRATISAPSLLKAIRLITASSRDSERRGAARCRLPQRSHRPDLDVTEPSAAAARQATPFLSNPAASPTALGNRRPRHSTAAPRRRQLRRPLQNPAERRHRAQPGHRIDRPFMGHLRIEREQDWTDELFVEIPHDLSDCDPAAKNSSSGQCSDWSGARSRRSGEAPIPNPDRPVGCSGLALTMPTAPPPQAPPGADSARRMPARPRFGRQKTRKGTPRFFRLVFCAAPTPCAPISSEQTRAGRPRIPSIFFRCGLTLSSRRLFACTKKPSSFSTTHG